MNSLSRNQINRLGDRLRSEQEPTDDDLALLAEFQRSLQPVLRGMYGEIEASFVRAFPGARFEATIREKQILSIVAKLRRERTRLSTVQDIVGFRIILPGARDQEHLLVHLPHGEDWRIIDRRSADSHGYRAIHVVRRTPIGSAELQIRTRLQHQWAELSERLDRNLPGTKYGQGPEHIQEPLMRYAGGIAAIEDLELMGDPTIEPALNRIRARFLQTLTDLIRGVTEGGSGEYLPPHL